MKKHRYTADEIALVRSLYPAANAVQIAKRIHGTGRAVSSIRNLIFRLRLRKWPRIAKTVKDSVRRLHRQDFTDTQIAKRLMLDRRSVTRIRSQVLGLSANQEAIHAAKVRGLATQRRTLGINNSGELRSLSFCRFAKDNGWPEDLKPREVQILNLLAAAGIPLTNLEIADKIGMRTDIIGGNGSLSLLKCRGPGGTYAARLCQRGLVSVLKKKATVHGEGKGRSRDLYQLGPAALAILDKRAKELA